MFSLKLNTKVFWELSGGGDLEKVKREKKKERTRERGRRNEERERQVTHNFHIFSHTGQILFPPEGKLTFLIKNNFSVKREKVALHIKRKAGII
jgi:hypothetical protein